MEIDGCSILAAATIGDYRSQDLEDKEGLETHGQRRWEKKR